jgi:hypothetical protein
MNLRAFRAVWGAHKATDGILANAPHLEFETLLPALKKQGYRGVEMCLSHALAIGPNKFKNLLDEHSMKVGFVIFSDGPVAPGDENCIFSNGPIPGYSATAKPGDPNKERVVTQHLDVFKEQVDAIHQHFPAHCDFINSHSCKDYFTWDMAETFFREALKHDENVMHECHRKRFLHSPWVCRDFLLPRFPKLKLVADLSHFTCVAETDPSDPDLTNVIRALAPMTHHVHCRVGYDHGPQVSDPRAPEWIHYMEGFERWWDIIWEAQIARGDTFSTFTPEHGPPSYQQTNPYSKEPLAHIWDVNHWIALRRQARFTELYGKELASNLIPSESQGYEPLTYP